MEKPIDVEAIINSDETCNLLADRARKTTSHIRDYLQRSGIAQHCKNGMSMEHFLQAVKQLFRAELSIYDLKQIWRNIQASENCAA